MNRKVLLIGWDSADWKIITPLLEAGLMPTLEKFINEGVMGNIGTLEPVLSPMLWNSIATGKLPKQHGILGFVEPMPDGSGIRLANSTSRKCKAIWNILSQSGFSNNVVGWFASHPAEPIRGTCVSNQFNMPPIGQKERWPVIEGSISPSELGSVMAEFRVHPLEIEGAHLQPFLPRGSQIDQTSEAGQKRITSLQKHLAECSSVHSIATWLMQNRPADFTAIYYNAIDIIGHHFMPFHPPRMAGIDEKVFEIYKDVITGAYRFHDMMLERLLQLAGSETTVILLSDHGFHCDHLRPQFGTGAFEDPMTWHRSHGIFCMKGPGILQDERIYGTSLLDIAPTILTLFGLPVGADMDGKPLIQAFEKPPQIEHITSWEAVPGEAGMHPADQRQDPVAAQQALQQLVELGYIEAPPQDKQTAIKNTVQQMRFHLAISELHYGNPLEAGQIFAELLAEKPDAKMYAVRLAQSYFKSGKYAECRTILEKNLDKNENSPAMLVMMGSLLQAEGKTAEALGYLQKAETIAPTLPQLHIHLGSAWLQMRNWKNAERSFRRALEIDGDNPQACNGLSSALLRQNKLEESVESALRAVGLQHHYPAAHFQLGAALAKLNQPKRAAMAFEHVLVMQPASQVTHRYLARLYYRLGDFKKCHEHHEAIAKLRDTARKSKDELKAVS